MTFDIDYDRTAVEHAADIARMAAERYATMTVAWNAEHHAYLCMPAERNGWCFVATPPGAVILYGDVGEAILRHSDSDSLGWLRRAASREEYPDYLLSKVEAMGGRRKQLCVPDLKPTRRSDDTTEEFRQLQRRWRRAREYRDDLDIIELAHRFAGYDGPHLAHSSTALWIWHALCAFVANLPATSVASESAA